MTVEIKELPEYQCHKRVRALKIREVQSFKLRSGQYPDAVQFYGLLFEDPNFPGILVELEWFEKHKPEPGGYYVVYEDGYRSYSPAGAFESGYTRILPKQSF